MEKNLILMTMNRRIVCLKTIAFDKFASYGELGIRRSAVVFTTWRNLGKLPIPLLKQEDAYEQIKVQKDAYEQTKMQW